MDWKICLLILSILTSKMIYASSANYGKQCQSGSTFWHCNDSQIVINNICYTCTSLDQLVAICNITNADKDIPEILDNIDQNMTALIGIIQKTMNNGELSRQRKSLNMSGIHKLRKLKKLQIIDTETYALDSYYLHIDDDAGNLTNVDTLGLNIPMKNDNQTFISTVEVLDRFTQLKFLDISHSKTLGFAGLHMIIAKHHMNIETLCASVIQYPGFKGYMGDIRFLLYDDKYPIIFDNLKEIDVSNNGIVHIHPGMSRIVPNLRVMDLSNNQLVALQNSAIFMELLLHPVITMLNASHQEYSQTDNFRDGMKVNLIRKVLPSKEIDPRNLHFSINRNQVFCVNHISKGNISTVFNSTLDTCHILVCIYPEMFHEIKCDKDNSFLPALSHMFNTSCVGNIEIPIGPHLRKLDFSGIQLQVIPFESWTLPGNLCFNKQNRLQEITVNENKVWLSHPIMSNFIAQVSGITGLNQLEYLSIKNNYVNFSVFDSSSFLMKFPSLAHLDLSGNLLTHLDLASICYDIPRMKVLCLKDMHIKDIRNISLCNDLETLDVSFNSVYELVEISKNLKILNVSYNNIKWLSETFISQLRRNVTIDLRGNPLSCNCLDKYFTTGIKSFTLMLSKAHQFVGFDEYLCLGQNKSAHLVHDIKPETFCKKNFMESPNTQTVIITVCIFGILFLLLCVTVIYKKRYCIKYRFTLCKRKLVITKNQRPEHISKYDAFVAYCTEDRFWVHDSVIKTLEDKYDLTLCIHYRDFPVGAQLAETIVSQMEQSRSILLILSDQFLESSWCMFEIDIAISQSLSNNKQVIIVKLGNISSDLEPRVAMLLETKKYLRWPPEGENCEKNQELFWKKLYQQILSDNTVACTNFCSCYSRNFTEPEFQEEDEVVITELEGFLLNELPSEMKPHFQKAVQHILSVREIDKLSEELNEHLRDGQLPSWAYTWNSYDYGLLKYIRGAKEELKVKANEYGAERIMFILHQLREQKEEFTRLRTRDTREREAIIEIHNE